MIINNFDDMTQEEWEKSHPSEMIGDWIWIENPLKQVDNIIKEGESLTIKYVWVFINDKPCKAVDFSYFATKDTTFRELSLKLQKKIHRHFKCKRTRPYYIEQIKTANGVHDLVWGT
jgi:hypothetical protein